MSHSKTFAPGFTWGAATAAYQVEGGATADGKGEAIWDVFCRRPDAVKFGEDGSVSCDHYHRYKEDVALMRQIGLQAYRFSLCWSRLLPAGTGAVNPAGLDFYDRLIDCLLAAGIEPWINICHFDLPQELFRRGGWLNPAISDWFADYTGLVARKYGDRVGNWFTFNEPNVMVMKGYWNGSHAPGLRLSLGDCLRAAHHILLSHGKAVHALRAQACRPVKVGLAAAARKCAPLTETPADIAAARCFQYAPVPGCVQNPAWWTDPVFLGHYPEDAVAANGREMPSFPDHDFAIIAAPTDFLGFNCYGGPLIQAGPNGEPGEHQPGPGSLERTSAMGYAPSVIYWAMRFHHERYGIPLIVTENGRANDDWVHLDGRVHDPQRIDYTARYLRELHRLSCDGYPIQGYFHWTLLDNFEWSAGYSVRMGLIHVDYQTLQRTLKDSAYWYRDVIASNGARIWE